MKVRAVEHAIKGVPEELKEEKVPQQEASVKAADEHDDAGFGDFDAQE